MRQIHGNELKGWEKNAFESLVLTIPGEIRLYTFRLKHCRREHATINEDDKYQ